MSRESSFSLNNNTLIGFTDKRGTAWHYRADQQGTEPNHYAGAIPLADVERRLFSWTAEPRRVAVEIPTTVDDPAMHLDENGFPMKWAVETNRKAIVRSDNMHVMGLFKDGYTEHQFRAWLLGTVSNILGDTMQIGSAGSLRQGAVGWVQVEMPDTIDTPEGVSFRPNLLGCTSFDGSIATTFKRTVTVVVCDNTLEMARGEAGQQYKIKHTRNSGFKLKDARDALAIVESAADDFAAEVAALCATTVTDKQWGGFLEALTPTTENGETKTGRSLTMSQNKQDELRRLWNHDARVTPWKNTAFGVLQATNTYDHHIGIVRNTTRPERNMLSAITGTQAKADDETLTILGKILVNV